MKGVAPTTMSKTYLNEFVVQRSSGNGVTRRERMGLGATTGVTIEEPGIIAPQRDSQTERPTIASTWKTVVEASITDELLEWPADYLLLPT